MDALKPIYLTYREMREREPEQYLFVHDIPISYYTSLPLATKRWSIPAYAYFANSTVHLYGEPVRMSPPDRWWGLRAQGGQLLFYARTKIQAFAEDAGWEKVVLPNETRSIPEQKQALVEIAQLMDQVVLAFFSDQPAEYETRYQLIHALTSHIPDPLLPWYRALAPDFFAWLEA